MKLEQLQSVLPKAPEPWLNGYINLCLHANITDVNEQAMFLAQLAHESAQFTRLEENLSYSAERLSQVWPRRFPTPAAASPYAREPELLGNFVYANRLGNGPVASGDGWKFRGRGAIQLTGRLNYETAAQGTGLSLLDDPSLLCQPGPGLEVAFWFWDTHKCRAAAREGNLGYVTQRINGGLIGIEQRRALYNQILAAIRES